MEYNLYFLVINYIYTYIYNMNKSDETNKNIFVLFIFDCSQLILTLDHSLEKVVFLRKFFKIYFLKSRRYFLKQ